MKVRLGELINIRTGRLDANAAVEDGGYPFFTCSKEISRIDSYSYDCECVLVAGNGDLNVKYYNGKFDAYQRTYILESIDKNKLSVKYLFWFMKKYIDTLRFRSIGGVIKYIKLADLTDIQLPIWTLEEQNKLVHKLSLTQSLLDNRMKVLDSLDYLIKSRFVEMFGDPVENSRNFRLGQIRDVILGDASNGFFAKANEYNDDGNVGIICVGDVVNRQYSNIDNLRRTNATDKDIEKYSVSYGDMLFCRSSLMKEGIAKASIVPPWCNLGVLFECHVIRVQLDRSIIIPEFIQEFSNTKYFRNQMMKAAKTATMTTIGQKDILSGSILIPPIDLQNEFAKFVEHINKLKFATMVYNGINKIILFRVLSVHRIE